MKSSALQLRRYIVTELSVSANRGFDPDKKVRLGLRDVVAQPECRGDEKKPREWQIVLKLKHSQSAESNSPYFFMIETVGFFTVKESVPAERVAEFVQVNGASVLYSTAREVLRSVMAMGPYLPILLPTVCFYEPKRKAEGKKTVESPAVPPADSSAPDAGAVKKAVAEKA